MEQLINTTGLLERPTLPYPPYRVDLVGLQTVSALNYARLLRVFPAMYEQDTWRVDIDGMSQPPCEVVLRVCERSRYTTVIEMTSEVRGDVNTPLRWLGVGLFVRVYHDAQLAEVIAAQRTAAVQVERPHRHFQPRYSYPNDAMYQPDEKYQMNCLLGEWLLCCQTHGQCVGDVLCNIQTRGAA